MINWTIKDISSIIAAGESETVEFKESFNDESIGTIGAFSNAHGGITLIGIKDNDLTNGFELGGEQ